MFSDPNHNSAARRLRAGRSEGDLEGGIAGTLAVKGRCLGTAFLHFGCLRSHTEAATPGADDLEGEGEGRVGTEGGSSWHSPSSSPQGLPSSHTSVLFCCCCFCYFSWSERLFIGSAFRLGFPENVFVSSSSLKDIFPDR